MPTVQADRLTRIGAELLKAAGASDEEANAVAAGCVSANLAGHDSHGVIAIPTYIDRIKAGHIVPGAQWTIVQESPTTTVIDGHWGFGFHVNARAMALTIDKAKAANVAACTVFRQSHVGRLAAYPMMAMREGMIGLATADSGRSPKHVAPFGGREARLGTNPISIAVPSDLEAPFYLDMATSAVAAGKIQLAVSRGEEIPTGWIVDSEGRQTTDPRDFRKGGALLPLGGTEGYKGSGLAAMVEVLCGLLTGLGFGVEPTRRHNDGCFMAVFNVAAFRPLKDFKKEVAEFARYLKPRRGRKAQAACSIPARSNICASSSAENPASRWKRRLGTDCARWPLNTNWPPNWNWCDLKFFVIASEAKQSTSSRQDLDCFVAYAPRNDGR